MYQDYKDSRLTKQYTMEITQKADYKYSDKHNLVETKLGGNIDLYSKHESKLESS